MTAILEVKNLCIEFTTDNGRLPAAQGVSFSVQKGKTLGIVGESGSGKTISALSIMRLIPDPPGRITGGEVLYQGRNLLGYSQEEMRAIRGKKISMVFQEPMTSLNPVLTIGEQIRESLGQHEKTLSKKEMKERTVEFLNYVGIPDAELRYGEYPHQLSGGMRQRAMMAMALICRPRPFNRRRTHHGP